MITDMARIVKEQLNFNTFLLMVVGALVTVGVAKADRAFESITRLQVQQEDMSRRVGNIESFIGMVAPTSPKRKETQ